MSKEFKDTQDVPITDSIKFPVSYDYQYEKLRDARNHELANLKIFASSNAARLRLGDFIADAINEAKARLVE